MRKQTKLAVVLAAAALVAVASASLVSAAGWVQDGADWRYQDSAGDYVAEVMKKSGDTTFYLDADGIMAKDYFCEYNDNYYYFGSNGAMVRNTWVAIDPALVDSGDEDVDAYWYYFQDTGKAFKGGDSDVKKKKIDGKTYFFNSDGQMLTGWFDGAGEKYNPEDENDFVATGADDVVYYAGEDGVARAGWLAWSDGLAESQDIGKDDASDRQTIYFYFNTSNFKRIQGKEKTINGKKYRFDNGGIMYTGWEYDEDAGLTKASASEFKYYSGEDDGHLVKKGWVYAVPSEVLDSEKNYDDEEAYFYFNNSGLMVADEQRRINGKYYVFADNGIMKTGVVFLDASNKYKGKIDLEYTNGDEFVKSSVYYKGERSDSNNKVSLGSQVTDGTLSVHYFGSDGAKVTGNKIPVEFADDTYIFASKNSGGFTSEKKKKFYSNGFLLKATEDLKLGLVIASENNARQVVTLPTTGASKTVEFAQNVSADSDPLACYVVSTTGTKKKKGAYKDGDGNYWLVNANGYLVGIYDVQVKYATTNNGNTVTCQWKGNIGAEQVYTVNGTTAKAGSDGKDDTYIDFNCTDKANKTQKDHLVPINNDYCLNFLVSALAN